MMEFAWYSVISPEACSGILFKGQRTPPQLADALKLTSKDLRQLGVIDHVVPNPSAAPTATPTRPPTTSSSTSPRPSASSRAT
jgi:acetyl-CoA carboxylase carboxyl transferase subunit alpha